jgi:hypothetical protein
LFCIYVTNENPIGFQCRYGFQTHTHTHTHTHTYTHTHTVTHTHTHTHTAAAAAAFRVVWQANRVDPAPHENAPEGLGGSVPFRTRLVFNGPPSLSLPAAGPARASRPRAACGSRRQCRQRKADSECRKPLSVHCLHRPARQSPRPGPAAGGCKH